MDYPDDHGRPALYKMSDSHGRISQCQRLVMQLPYAEDGRTLSPRRNSPKLFMAGVIQTKTHGPGLYEASRLVPYKCWKNRSLANDFQIVQTESVTVSVNPWEIEKPVDPYPLTRHASFCAVPEGKIGSCMRSVSRTHPVPRHLSSQSPAMPLVRHAPRHPCHTPRHPPAI